MCRRGAARAPRAPRRRTHPITREGGIGPETLEPALPEGGTAAWEWDLDSGEIRWSPAVGPHFGLPPGAVPAGIDEFLALVHPDDRERVRASAGAAADRRTAHELRFRARWPDGTDHWLVAAGNVLPDPGGERVRYVGITRPLGEEERARGAPPEGERLFRQFA
jgi:PAS domain-containing protein